MPVCVHELCIHSSHLLWPTVTIRCHEVEPPSCGHNGSEPESRKDQGGEGGGRQVPPKGSPLQLRRPWSPQVSTLGEPHHHHPRDHRVVWEEAVSPQQTGRVGGESLSRGSVVSSQGGLFVIFAWLSCAAKALNSQLECLSLSIGFLLTLPHIQLTYLAFSPSWWKRSKELFLLCICCGCVFMDRCCCLDGSRG